MFARLLPVLLSIWLLSGLGGAQAHVHKHEHGNEPAHYHVLTAFDSEHAKAHVKGASDHDDDKAAPRAQPSVDLGLAIAPFIPTIAWSSEPLPVAFPQEMLARGPPPHVRPPSQAPPASFAFA